MVKIESKEVIVNSSLNECFEFLSSMNNYKELLPADKTTDWKSDETQCSFKLQNAYKLELIFDKKINNDTILLKSGPSSLLTFNLSLFLNEQNNNSTKAQLKCDAYINPLLQVIIEKPINHLFNYMADRLVKIKE